MQRELDELIEASKFPKALRRLLPGQIKLCKILDAGQFLHLGISQGLKKSQRERSCNRRQLFFRELSETESRDSFIRMFAHDVVTVERALNPERVLTTDFLVGGNGFRIDLLGSEFFDLAECSTR